jgi:ABC-type multidrug transport system fused ATPase/permease subunit
MKLNEIVLARFKHPGMIASIVLNLLGYVLMDIIFPKMTGAFIDNIDSLSLSSTFRTLSPLLVSQAFFYASDSMYSKASTQVNDRILDDLLRGILTSDTKTINKVDLVKNIFYVFDIDSILHLLVAYFFPTAMISLVLFVYFMRIDPSLGITFASIFGVATTILCVYIRRSIDASKQRDEKHTDYLNELDDIFTNLPTIHFDNMNSMEAERLRVFKETIMKYYVKSHDASKDIKFIVSVVSLIILITLTTMLVRLYKNSRISKGELISYIYLVLLLLQYYDISSYEIDPLMSHIGNYVQSSAYFSQFKPSPEQFLPSQLDGSITVENVRGPHRNVSFHIPANRRVGITGDIGTGKSTLLKMMMKLVPYEGTIRFGKRDIQTFDSFPYVTYIPQRIDLFNRTIYENLVYGLDTTREEVERVIVEHNLVDFFRKFQDGLDTVVVRNGENVSGGQKQILYLIKAILQQRPIVLMDEPTASLSAEYVDLFLRILNKFHRATIVIVTHDKRLEPFFEQKILL